jgi:hypothetical protein
MKLEYLSNSEADESIIRLFEFTPAEVSKLAFRLTELANERETEVQVHALSGISTINKCELTLRLTKGDQGLIDIQPSIFACGFTANTWDNIAGLVEPFTQAARGFQWLVDSPGEARLLLSSDGHW